MVERIGPRRVISRLPARFVHRRRETVWSSRGEGWGFILNSRGRKIGTNEGGRSQRPPFFLVGILVSRTRRSASWRCTAEPGPILKFVRLHNVAKAAYLGRILRKAAV